MNYFFCDFFFSKIVKTWNNLGFTLSANKDLLKVNNTNKRKSCEICFLKFPHYKQNGRRLVVNRGRLAVNRGLGCKWECLVVNTGNLVVNRGLGCKWGFTTPDRVIIKVVNVRSLVVNRALGCKWERLVVNRKMKPTMPLQIMPVWRGQM